MHHNYIDKYSDGTSIIHRIRPEIKIIGYVLFLLTVIFTKSTSAFALYFLVLIVAIFISRIPLPHVLKRLSTIVPFVILVALVLPFTKAGTPLVSISLFGPPINLTREGLASFQGIVIKSLLCMTLTILLMGTTPFTLFLKGLAHLKIPGLFIMIMSFMYRYIFVIMGEAMIMRRARQARSVSNSKWLGIRTSANMIGSLFLRSFERGENVYLAMCARGFTGKIETTTK